MNKIFKLPIFLGVVGCVCGAILAGVNYVTNPIIVRNDENKKAQAYLSIFNDNGYSVKQEDIASIEAAMLSDDLFNNGCTGMAKVASIRGAVYDFSVNGYGGTVSFQIAFADGKYVGYTDISNNETGGYGKEVIAGFSGVVKGYDASINLLEDVSYQGLIAGRSITGKAIATAASYASADYSAIEW